MATAPFKVKAIFEYSSPHEDDLHFSIGQVITVTEEEDADWYMGEYTDESGAKHEGLFPRNFVEKYEPTAPPRPVRARTKKEPELAAAASESPAPALPQEPPAPESPVEDIQAVSPPSPPAEPTPSAVPVPAPAKPADPAPGPVPVPVPAVPKTSEPAAGAPSGAPKPSPAAKAEGPPPVSEKPSSFKDRIAAFNRPAAPPVAPFKPTGLAAGSGFVRKPFVPPPPSRNAYVPPARDVPVAKIYRREEDPEIREREAENQESAEKAGLVPGSSPEAEEDQPKPLSLKERMALLQRQQHEQAQRHADVAAKKEKPKRPPPKKRTESHEAAEGSAEAEPTAAPPMERRDTDETGGKKSMDSARAPPPPRRSSIPKPIVSSESFNDGNEADMSGAGDTTEDQEDLAEQDQDDSDDRPNPLVRLSSGPPPAKQVEDEDEDEGEEEEDDDDVDPEIRRKEELRARMAKMSGGMGMHGMFGPPAVMPMPGAAPPRRKKAPPPPERDSAEHEEEVSPSTRAAPPIPMMMALPGLSQSRPQEPPARDEPEKSGRAPPPPPPARPADGDEDVEDESEEEDTAPAPPSIPSRDAAGPPPIPGGRPVPPPVPTESRPPRPALPPAVITSPSAGSESDDELSERARPADLETPKAEVPPALRSPPPLPPSLPSPGLPSATRSPPAPPALHSPSEELPSSPTSNAAKRASRPPPPVPGAVPSIPPAQSRPPPPPPPTANVSRQSTSDIRVPPIPRSAAHRDDDEEEVTEYEGDYDTDIASSVPHRDALKSHARESSFEDNTPVRSPVSEAPPSLPPPVPTAAAPRAVPPPIPSQPPPDKRRSMDQPRAAPPPPPPPKQDDADDEFDSYNYSSTRAGPSSAGGYAQKTPKIEEEAYFPETALAQSPSHSRAPPLAASRAAPPRPSLDPTRRSTDARPSAEFGFIANDIDLAKQSGWWKQANQVPPALQGRRDVYFESEETTSTNRGAKTVITRTIRVLFLDYSQTILTVRFDPYDPADVELEQHHEPPPRTLRQDQLEESYDRFGSQISQAVAGKKDQVVGDGTPQGLIYDLLRPFRDALAPVGTRAYGALVYANMANASTQQHDEIRPGDIMSVRNAKFQGKHGAMHAKYSMEVGRPDHVAVVAEWDGTKKKVRAWEQGRESKKVKLESFKLDDLRSGEVRVWRVMPRGWVGWNTVP